MKKLETKSMVLLKHHLKALRLPTIHAECEKVANRCACDNVDHLGFLLQLCELELIEREKRAADRRLKAAKFPNLKTLEAFDFTVQPSINRLLVMELMRCAYIDNRESIILIGNPGTGKTHIAVALGMAACRKGYKVRFFTAASLVNRLEEAQKQYQLERLLSQLDRTELLICDELGYLSFSRTGAELLFQVFADRYERKSLLLTSNLPFSDWGQIFQGERMTAALLDRLTHHCEIFQMNGESYRFRESMKKKAGRKAK